MRPWPQRMARSALAVSSVQISPATPPLDKSGTNTAAIRSVQGNSGADIELRQSKYLNNIVKQDHRAVKRIVRPMLGFTSFHCAPVLITGIETMHMIEKGQLDCSEAQTLSTPIQFSVGADKLRAQGAKA